MIYMDTSALAKRYLEESGTETIQTIVADAEVIATSKLAYPEMLSAFMRKHRSGEIKRKPLHTVLARFQSDWENLLIVDFHDELLPIIKRLMERLPLKGADSVHLSSALWLEKVSSASVTFVASDANLIQAAKLEGMATVNP
jgi:uncharacterized protein